MADNNWATENYLAAAGLALGAVGLAAGPRAPQQVQQAPQQVQQVQPLKRTVNDITMPIFRAEVQRRKILTMKAECKSNWWGNGFNSMVCDLLFFELEELKIVNDTGHLINDDNLYVVNNNLVNIDNIKKLHKTGFENELKCYDLNEKELYNFLLHYKNKAVVNQNLKIQKPKNTKNVKVKSKTNVKVKSKTNVKVKSKTNKNLKRKQL
jgi:hypothetical protein